ncbi:MAG: radical SAM protein, partial [bacterium]|nr:radical SAM protein [bacterium]
MNKTAARGSSPGKVASPSPPPSAATVPDGFEHQQIPENLHRLQLLLVDQVDGQWFAFDPPSGNITFISEQRAADLHRVRNSSAGEGDGELRAALVEQLSYAPVPTTPSDPDRSGVSLSLHLNHGCNLACTYCYADGRISDGEGTAKGTYGGKVSWMPPEIVARSIEKLAVTMFGGEPLLSERRFIEAMAVVDEQARRFGRQVRVVVVTNGTK